MNAENVEFWYGVFNFSSAHIVALFSGISCFFVSLWASLSDGYPIRQSLLHSIICVFIALAIVAILKMSGTHNSWMPGIGVVIGLIGAVRIRNAVLGAWEHRKNIIPPADKKDDN